MDKTAEFDSTGHPVLVCDNKDPSELHDNSNCVHHEVQGCPSDTLALFLDTLIGGGGGGGEEGGQVRKDSVTLPWGCTGQMFPQGQVTHRLTIP